MQGTNETGREITTQGVMTTSHHGAQGDVMNIPDIIDTPGKRDTAAESLRVLSNVKTPDIQDVLVHEETRATAMSIQGNFCIKCPFIVVQPQERLRQAQ